jgi:peptide/nickel transport system substrate-binding protein
MADNCMTDLVERLSRGEISRRDFIKRAIGAGVSASAVASVLAEHAQAAPASTTRSSVRYQADAKTLVIADALSGLDWLTLDPGWFYEIHSTAGMNILYEPLYHIPDGSKVTDVQPLLADGMPDISADGLTVTVKLRQGVKFHTSGNVMTADDWVFSFNRVKNIGYQNSFLASDYWTDVKALDESTLQFTLPSPNAAIAAVLTSLPLSVVDSKVVKANGGVDQPSTNANVTVAAGVAQSGDTAKDYIDNNSVGTGPYLVKQFDRNGEIIVERNPDYWGEAPKLDRIIWRNVNEPIKQLEAVQAGEADIAYEVPTDSVQSVKDDPNLQLLTGPTLAIEYIGINIRPERGPLSNKLARQALGWALDYQAIIDGVMGGAAVKPATVIPLGLTGTEEAKDLGYSLDLAKAQELWDQSGVGEVEIEMTYDSDQAAQGGGDLETLATIVKDNLEKINGVKVKLAPLPGTERIGNYRAGDFQTTISPWTPDYPDVDTFAGPFGRGGTAAAKRVGYDDPETTKLLDEGLSETDPEKRTQIYVEVQKRMIDAAAFLVLYQPIDQKAASKNVQGVTTHPVYQLQLRFASKSE